ncbi:MAG TPA: hypothetical protein VLE50_11965 [Cellvibrio sp.]|nr:hypothetical protein [Cellvibrio sp.]
MSSAAPSSIPASSAGVVVSSAAVSSAPASSAGVVSSAALSSTPASSVASSVVASSLASYFSSSSSAPLVVQTGVFVDSAVAGVSYVTAPGGFTGVTSATGQYQFAEGDKVVFSIGAIEFPEVTAKGVVTPVDMAASGDVADPIVVNIAVLLQSLDADGDPGNGISIPAAAVVAADENVDFDQPYSAFAAEILAVVQHSDSGKAVVSDTVATAHLEESLEQVKAGSLAGTWYTEGDNYRYALFVLDSSHYAAVDYDASVTEGIALETGTYAWNQETGVVTLSGVQKTESGLDAVPPMATGNILEVDGDTMTLTDGDETFVLHRLEASAEKPLKGGWSVSEEGSLVVFALTDTHYLMGQQSVADDSGEPGAEVGTYEHNVETGAVKVSTIVDTNGQWGISHPCAILNEDGANDNYEQSNFLNCGPEGSEIVQTFNATGDTLTFISEADTIADDRDNDGIINGNGEEQPAYFDRVLGVPDGDIHLKVELTVEFLEYIPGELFSYDNGNATMKCERTGYPAVGTKEIWIENWVLGGNSNRPTWTSNLPATFNPETKVVSFDIRGPITPVKDNEYFSTQPWERLSVNYTPSEDQIITGTFSEGHDLTWKRDSSVSSCQLIYSVKGILH